MLIRILSILALIAGSLASLPLSFAQPVAGLAGSAWQLVAIGGSPALANVSVTLSFDTEGRAGGSGGCNGYGASYDLADDALSFGALISTMMACRDDIMQQEIAYFAALEGVSRYAVVEGQLILFYGEEQLLFVPLATLANTQWQLSAVDDTAPLGDAPLTLIFEDERRVSGFSGCNNFAGDYSASLGRIRFEALISTLIACLDDDLMQQEMTYQAALQEATAYTLEDDRLTITTSAGQTLIFARVWSLVNTQWQLESLAGAAVLGNIPLTIEFDDEGRFSGSSGCNQYGGAYTVEGDALSFGPLFSTRRACLEQALAQQEQALFHALETVVAFEQSAEALILITREGQQLVFAPQSR